LSRQQSLLRDYYVCRLLVGVHSHYNAGGGTDVWLDGKHLKDGRKGWTIILGGSGRHSNKPWGVTIADDQRKYLLIRSFKLPSVSVLVQFD